MLVESRKFIALVGDTTTFPHLATSLGRVRAPLHVLGRHLAIPDRPVAVGLDAEVVLAADDAEPAVLPGRKKACARALCRKAREGGDAHPQ